MIKARLLHPEILAVLARAGHSSKILIVDEAKHPGSAWFIRLAVL